MVTIHVLGTFAVSRRAGKLGAAARQPRPLALLALAVAAGPRGLSREQALLYLWPDSTIRKARNSLNQTVYALRRGLGEPELFLAGSPLRLNPAVVTTDHWNFERALARRDLEAAAAEYGGDFLSQFTLAGAPEFERWMEGERNRLGQRYFQSVATLAERADERGDHRRAAEWWWTLTAQEPLSSIVARGLISALTAAGDRTAALTYAKTYRELVASELGVEIDAGVKQLIAHIESDTVPDVALVTEPQLHRLLDELSGSERFASPLGEAPRGAAAPTRKAKRGSAHEPRPDEFFRTLVETAPDMIYTTDRDGCIVYTNPAGCKLLDVSSERIVGRAFIEFVREDFRHPMLDFYARQTHDRIPVTYYEFPVVSAAGATAWLGQHAQLVFRDERVAGTIAIARDITLRKRLERTQHQLSARDRATKLLNAAAFRVLVDHRVAMSDRTGTGFLLVFIAVDNAEDVQVNEGAAAADALMQAVAAGVVESFRRSDVVARVRADTIAVLATNSAEATVRPLHDRIVARVADAVKAHHGVADPRLRVTATFYDPQLPSTVDSLLTNVVGVRAPAHTRADGDE